MGDQHAQIDSWNEDFRGRQDGGAGGLRGLGQPGKDIYLMGGAQITTSLIDAGLVDELRLIVYPLIAGEGKALFATTERCRALELRKVQQLPDGRVSVIYGIAAERK
jgi:dihydrofolate reductase